MTERSVDMINWKPIAPALLVLAVTMAVAKADWRFDAETGAFYNSNLSESDKAADEKDDWAWKSDVRAGDGLQLSRDLRLNVAGDVGGEVWDRFSAFNNIDVGASAGLRPSRA